MFAPKTLEWHFDGATLMAMATHVHRWQSHYLQDNWELTTTVKLLAQGLNPIL